MEKTVMSQKDKSVLELTQEYREQMADGITRPVARLYSHYARLRQEQDGLVSWTEDDAKKRLSDAVELVEAAFVEQELNGGVDKDWQSSMRRAGEILEWLSHPKIELSHIPTQLLASAAYQLAGYPARSAGLLASDLPTPNESQVLRQFLQADFPHLFSSLVEYWARFLPTDRIERVEQSGASWSQDPESFSEWVRQLVVGSTLSALGVLAAEMRWGDERRVDKAIAKLLAVSKLLLHSDDPYSWLLAKMCAMVSSTYVDSSLRRHLRDLDLSQRGQEMLERYLRQSYQWGKTLAWPSQLCGIERLQKRESFALCTPTGSGKTTVAEIAILRGLFSTVRDSFGENFGLEPLAPLVIYLVPSRALAAEVEFKLSQVFESLGRGETPIIITGLYGGTDWGPTDAWLTRDTPTILICTYEKGEALIRFMGPSFLGRVSLVIVDEAHLVQFNGKYVELQEAESRPLRLEVLSTRLFSIVERNQGRIIALSAVAEGIENELSSWVAGIPGAQPAKSPYQSTRQLIGCLECKNRQFKIVYDLLDRTSLRFDDAIPSEGTLYVPSPFPPHPPAPGWEPIEASREPAQQLSLPGVDPPSEKQASVKKPGNPLRPYLFWAAMQIAAIRERGRQHAVLVSVPQSPSSYAKDFLALLELWENQYLPTFFQPPQDAEERELWERCLASCEDYFGRRLREFQLLQKGVIIHHGRMPGLMARLLVEVIQEHIVGLVIATSTLTEGVNLPFEVVLIPSLRRGRDYLSMEELGNLMGRAGRPGYGTEGRSLVLISNSRARRRYEEVIQELQSDGNGHSRAVSPLAKLISHLYDQWRKLTSNDQLSEFLGWLEMTSPLNPQNRNETNQDSLIDTLDTLDSVLLAAIVELESIARSELSADELEGRLKEIWQRSYAHFASTQEQDWEQIFVRRGQAIVTQIYPSPTQRRRLYCTSLPPRSGSRLLDLYTDIRVYLETGTEYACWDRHKRFEYVKVVAEQIAQIPKFAPGSNLPEKAEWFEVLHWWLDRDWIFDSDVRTIFSGQRPRTPSPERVSEWHKYIRKSFVYKLNWGIGSFIALALNKVYGDNALAPSVDDWPETGLPWVVFWLKELITWGTLDPVAAYLLAREGRRIATRPDAERRAQSYYEEQPEYMDADDLLNAESIRNWAKTVLGDSSHQGRRRVPPKKIGAMLLRDFTNATDRRWRVLPAEKGEEILWFDPAGFLLAKSTRPTEWRRDWSSSMDFSLDHSNMVVLSERYL